MLKLVPATAAALLMFLTPAMAANPPQSGKAGTDVRDKAQSENQNTVAAPSEQTSDDDIQIIIMGKGVQVQVPNPYQNPRPRLITDAWAMRA